MSEILIAIVTTLGWIGTLVVWLLLQAQGPGASLMLKRHIRWKLIAWSSLVLIQLFYSLELDLQISGIYLSWLNRFSYDHVGQIVFRGLLALAMWNFILDILRPQTIPIILVPEAQIDMNPYGIVLGWNNTAEALFGWTAEEVVNQELASFLLPESYREAHRQGLAHYRKTSEAPIKDFVNTLPALTKDKGRITVDLRIKETLTARGTVFQGLLTPTVILK